MWRLRVLGVYVVVPAALLLLCSFGCKKATEAVRIGYFANVTHAQAVLAVSSGDLARAVAPLEVQTKIYNAGPTLIQDLLAGNIDIGYIGPGPAISKGPEDVRIIAGAAANGVLIVAAKDSPITSVTDLPRYTLATPQFGNTQDISARHYYNAVLNAGSDGIKRIKPTENARQLNELGRGIDAAWVPEPWGSRLIHEAGAKLIAKEHEIKELWPEGKVCLTVVVTTKKFLAEHPDVVEKVLGVHHAWTQRLQKDPQQYKQRLSDGLYKLSNVRLKDEVLTDSLRNVEFTDEPLESTLKKMAAWFDELQPKGSPPTKLDGLVDLTLLKKVQ
jgi:NitT/TauT family transport system substrate-binding protein